ncbi:MAG: hypothetical protein V2A77_02755 [Pseudomonadota bacterium]
MIETTLGTVGLIVLGFMALAFWMGYDLRRWQERQKASWRGLALKYRATLKWTGVPGDKERAKAALVIPLPEPIEEDD